MKFTTAVLALALLAAAPSAQTWETAAGNPGDDSYVQLPYMVLFVANEGHADEATETAPHYGLDVLSANNPAPHGVGGGMYALMPDGAVKKLFPLPEHDGIIDSPVNGRRKGAVVEPNMSQDGRTVHFSYFHDASWEKENGGYQQLNVSYKGADLYSMDLGPLIDDPTVHPRDLPVLRLTHKQYTGPAKSDVFQTTDDKLRMATNPTIAAGDLGTLYWGIVDMHMIEMETQTGTKAVWVSNRTCLGNSNKSATNSNQNFSLFIADLKPDGTLGEPQQWQYYTTTSALSPIPLRNGLAFSYQSSTDDVRRWDIQALDSEGRWIPLIGYAHGSELFHFGSLIVDDSGGTPVDYFLGLKYYHLNDGGFGNLHKVLMSDAGLNEFVPGPQGIVPRQLSTNITPDVSAQDGPSPLVNVNGQDVYLGKFSSPRGGRIGGEYFVSYTPTSANRWLLDAEGNKCRWAPYIAYRPNLDVFNPREDVDVAAGEGLYKVVVDSTEQYGLLWPTPVLSWLERTGDEKMGVAEPIRDPRSTVKPGEPYAQIGTSAIWNTDVRPYDCYLGNTGRPFNPNALTHNEWTAIVRSHEGLRYVPDPADPCRYAGPEDVMGIRINMTSNRVHMRSLWEQGYETAGEGKRREMAETLGVFSVTDENEYDQSYMATIPADVPFEFHLVDSRYGMKIVDVRSWHSLKAQETRRDCGGCHQHEAGFGIPFEGTEAASKPPMDMTETTRYVAYDADCKPVIAVDPTPTKRIPEWNADIWPGIQQHCSSCHDSDDSSDAAALAAWSYPGPGTAWVQLWARNYANPELGALGSPAFWAAYGARTDGRDNDDPEFTPDYASGQWGYYFSSIHATQPGLCSADNPAWAEWVREFGEWIDHHMPRDTGLNPIGADFDRYHPAVDFALLRDKQRIRVGWWDNADQTAVQVEVNDVVVLTLPAGPNNSVVLPLSPTLELDDVIRITAVDPAGNRQLKAKTMRELLRERRRGGYIQGSPVSR